MRLKSQLGPLWYWRQFTGVNLLFRWTNPLISCSIWGQCEHPRVKVSHPAVESVGPVQSLGVGSELWQDWNEGAAHLMNSSPALWHLTGGAWAEGGAAPGRLVLTCFLIHFTSSAPPSRAVGGRVLYRRQTMPCRLDSCSLTGSCCDCVCLFVHGATRGSTSPLSTRQPGFCLCDVRSEPAGWAGLNEGG